MRRFTTETMHEITTWCQARLSHTEPGGQVTFQVPDPDLGDGLYAGELSSQGTDRAIHRGLKAWVTFAELLRCRLRIPHKGNDGYVTLTLSPLNETRSFHHAAQSGTEKYGTASPYARIHKNEEPSYYFWLSHALASLSLPEGGRVLDLGANRGDSFQLLSQLFGEAFFTNLTLTGVDHCPSATAQGSARFSSHNVTFLEASLADLESLKLAPFDLVISVGTLQSPGVDFQHTVRYVTNNLLTTRGALILGFPNCRWVDGEMIQGAGVPNYSFPELSLLLKDVAWCRRYLHQHKFRVTVTGREYLFLTAHPINRT